MFLAGFLGLSISDLVQGDFRPLKFVYWISGLLILGGVYLIFICYVVRNGNSNQQRKNKEENSPK